MPALDLPAVRSFTEDLSRRAHRCDNGEGTEGSTLDASIIYYIKLCRELRTYINDWARAIFATKTVFDPQVEGVLKEETKRLLHRAKQLAALGRAMNGQCFEPQGLEALHYYVADFDYLLENWVSPRPAVSPAPWVKLPDAAARQVAESLDKLPALPSDWRPTDPTQVAIFQKQKQ
jgi:hypothetical protein